MRPRFSMRWLLIAFTLFAVALYALFVRPTVVANRFARAANSGDYQYALSFIEDEPKKTIGEYLATMTKPTIKVTIRPRSWRDIWKVQRSLHIQVIPAERASGSQLPNVGPATDAVATVAGVRGLKIYLMTYGPSPSGVILPSQTR